MSRATRRLAEARAARDAARAQFDAQLFRLRGDPQAQTLGERMTQRLGDDARQAMDRALDVASESKGIAAATAGLLALWFLRGPLLEQLGALWGAWDGPDDLSKTIDQTEEAATHAEE